MIAHIVRCFDDPNVNKAAMGRIDAGDIEVINTSTLADLQTVDKQLVRYRGREVGWR